MRPSFSAQPLTCNESFHVVNEGVYRVCLPRDMDAADLLRRIQGECEVLKEGKRARVLRAGSWFVKMRRTTDPVSVAMHVITPHVWRRPWYVGHRLYEQGIATPRPVAYLEKKRLGLVIASAYVTEYLEDCRTSEEYLDYLVIQKASRDAVLLFFEHLAQALCRLFHTGIWHQDLSGKNLLTRDGRTFFVVDWDACVSCVSYSPSMRFTNLVQLYDSFCDRVSDRVLVPFIDTLLEGTADIRVIMPHIREGQRRRRSTQLRRWARQGILPKKPLRYEGDEESTS